MRKTIYKHYKRIFKIVAADSIQLHNLLLISAYWAPKDSIQSKQALNHVLLHPNKEVLSKAMLNYYQGYYYTHQSQKEKAKAYYKKVIEDVGLVKNTQSKMLLARAWYQYAYIQVEEKGYDYMVEQLTTQCIPLAIESKNKELQAYFKTQLGLTFMSVGQFDTAEEHHLKALAVLQELPTETATHLITYFNLISNYCYKPDSQSAKIYIDKASRLIEKYPTSSHFPNYYYQQAMYFTTKQEYSNAIESLDKGVKSATELKQWKLLQLLKFRMYNVHLMLKDYNKAQAVLEDILQDNILTKEVVNRKITFSQLAYVNQLQGNYKEAYQWLTKASVLGDSIQQNKLLEKMNELEILHKTAEKQQTIDNLKREKIENALKAKNKNLRLGLLAIALVLLLIIAILIYINYKNQKKLTTQIQINHQQQLHKIEQQHKYEATQAILQGEEQERQRIAQDLHDSIGGMLANIRMILSNENTDRIQNAEDILKKLDKSIIEMRRISRNLMPETLKNLGIEIALKELCESMSHQHLTIQFEAFDISENIPFQTQLALYRITQESISNVIKYAQASNVIVQISQHNNLINLTIEDDGVGFDTYKIHYGMGLKNIENRIKLVEGSFEIISEVGEGTTINIECYA